MKLGPKSIDECPHCHLHTGNAIKNGSQAICIQCGERWRTDDYGWWIKQTVRVENSASCWHGCVGTIEEIVSPTLVRVLFRLNKYRMGGDIFHPFYLKLISESFTEVANDDF